MKAIVSDIHANLEALSAVLADTVEFSVDSIYCLGDVLGYGPNPRECFDLARGFALVLRGETDDLIDPSVNHDIRQWSVGVHRMVRWTQSELSTVSKHSEEPEQRFHFLRSLKPSQQGGGVLMVHGSPRKPLDEYVFPEDTICAPKKLESNFALFERCCFQGHTHVPGVFTEQMKFSTPEEIGHRFHLNGKKAMINVGSVGQPRDGDPRACYVLLDGESIIFRRVDYDSETTMRKIRDNPDLNGPWR